MALNCINQKILIPQKFTTIILKIANSVDPCQVQSDKGQHRIHGSA